MDPFPKTKSGYRYILTVMCLGTRYPYAIPLKKVDAITIAEGLIDVLAQTGITQELLSDQGSVFIGRVNKELCRLLNIDKLRTTAYHHQTNGIFERWHCCLKGMLRKVREDQDDWARLLKFCLLAYRATPLAATGFSPYELVHGRNLREPLEAMNEGWVRREFSFSNKVDWFNNLRKTLTILHEAAWENEEAFKAKTKAAYDEKAQERHFEPGDMVVCHTPGLTGKLHTIWAGPYEVTAKISNTYYKLAVPDKWSHTEVVHIKRLKEWKTPTANLFRVVVADKSGDSPDPIGKVGMGTPALTSDQKSELAVLLEGFSDVATTELGKVLGTEHVIDTCQVQPIRTTPYSIVPGWRAELKAEIHFFVRQGILVPTRSPWSSPMVPVRKFSGLVGLCIDYKKLIMRSRLILIRCRWYRIFWMMLLGLLGCPNWI